MTDTCKIRRALISVSDKTGLIEVARDLAARGMVKEEKPTAEIIAALIQQAEQALLHREL